MGPWGLRCDIDKLPYTRSLYVTLLQDHLFFFLQLDFVGEELCQSELSPFAVSQECLVWKTLLCLVRFIQKTYTENQLESIMKVQRFSFRKVQHSESIHQDKEAEFCLG